MSWQVVSIAVKFSVDMLTPVRERGFLRACYLAYPDL